MRTVGVRNVFFFFFLLVKGMMFKTCGLVRNIDGALFMNELCSPVACTLQNSA